MTNEEIQEIVAKADAEYDRLKDRVHEQYDEIKRLNNIIKEAINYINSQAYSNISNSYNELYNGQIEELVKILEGVNKE